MLTVQPLLPSDKRAHSMVFWCTSTSVTCWLLWEMGVKDYVTSKIEVHEGLSGAITKSVNLLKERNRDILTDTYSVVMESPDSRSIVTEYYFIREHPHLAITKEEGEGFLRTITLQLKETLKGIGYVDATLVGALILDISIDDTSCYQLEWHSGFEVRFQVASSVQSVKSFRRRSREFRKVLGITPTFIHPSLALLRDMKPKQKARSEILFGDSIIYFLTYSEWYRPRIDQLPIGDCQEGNEELYTTFLAQAFDAHASGLASDCLTTHHTLHGSNKHEKRLTDFRHYSQHIHPNVFIDKKMNECASYAFMKIGVQSCMSQISGDKMGNIYKLAFLIHV